ncbi:hypothetical protein WOLCODRAFT_164969 [Wolfiporia cocos MD-104 SS10]|uniref:F-box domain-containing protein n=1 Tax=Wolfiporia cocos (strain MD-104) TaxID=742152 RepID=A0A2H3K225_WOLCO|nr:hypothetical protein WOLCODRAFT_164969 [Wolfiporia cocos MD-104 SS10]
MIVQLFINDAIAFDVEAQILRDIEWRPPKSPHEPLVSRRHAIPPQFSTETVASQIPIEIWEKILRYLRDEPETLGIAEEVCRGWYMPSRRLKRSGGTKHVGGAEDNLTLSGDAADRDRKRSIAHLGTFAAMFAGRQLPRLSWLLIIGGEWRTGTIHDSVFLGLSTFRLITRLSLYDLTLPSATVFLRLICALDGLNELHVRNLRLLDRRVPPASRRWQPSPDLKSLRLSFWDQPDELGALSPDAELQTSSGYATISYLLAARNCSDLQQLLHHAGKSLNRLRLFPLGSLSGGGPYDIQPLRNSATLTAAREANTDFVLILGDDGLNSIGARDRELLTLLEPFSTTIPIGSRGIVENDSDLSCVAASGVPRPVSFLLPPFIMPVDIIPPTALKEDEMYGVWRTLGKEISLRRSDGVGGYSVGSGDTSRSPWCKSHQDSHAGDTQTPPSLVGSSEMALINPVSAAPTNATCGVHLSALGTFLLVFGSFTELSNFSPAACRIRDEGHTVYALIISSANEQDHSGMQIESCGLGYDIFRQTNSTLQNLRHIVSWIDKQPSLPDVFITSFPSSVLPDDTLSISPLLDATPTVIRIPAADLPYCDWMSSLTVQELRSKHSLHWHTPQVDISVITNDRPRSLSRLLASLSNARYFGDTPDLRINLEQTADVETLRMVEGFQWGHGRVFLHRRVIHGGLLIAVVESWYPHSNDSYGLILEDDVEVSPLFYAWIKMTLLRYRYGHAKESSSQLFGISLYQQKNLELRPEGRHPFNARNAFAAIGIADPSTPYLSQIPCSWGAVYFPEHWREFHTYLSLRLSESVWDMDQVVVPGVRSNKWTRSWKKYFIELVYLRGYVMLYPNFADFVSLSTNHLEVGSHVKDVPFEAYLRKKKLFLLPLIRLPESPSYETGLIDLPGRSLPPYALLPTLDLLGLHATDEDLLERGQRRRTELTGCKSTVGNQHDAFDLLCVGEAGLDTLRK